MGNNNIHLSIITLSKNDNIKLSRTLKSIYSQKINLNIELIIIDGSSKKIQEKNKKLIKKLYNIKKEKYISIKYFNSLKKKIFGIYPCMNYGKKVAKGNYLMFLNSGDQFYNINSLQIILEKTTDQIKKNCLIFGQANIIASNNLNWLFPGSNLRNYENWIKLFEPNHQAMIISNRLANIFDFPTNMESVSDGYWKRLIIKNSKEIIYINQPIVNFFLDGVSAIKPSYKELVKILNNKNINIFRKLIFFIKYLFPRKLFFVYHKLQKYKSLIIDFIF